MKTSIILLLASAMFGVACQSPYPRAPSAIGPIPAGIAEKPYAYMQADAAEEMQCPQEQLRYERLGQSRHLLKGCGQSVEMLFLSYRDADTFRVGPSPTNRFSKEARCGLLESTAERAQRDTYIVDGCGQRVTYVLMCPTYQRCKWVADLAQAP